MTSKYLITGRTNIAVILVTVSLVTPLVISSTAKTDMLLASTDAACRPDSVTQTDTEYTTDVELRKWLKFQDLVQQWLSERGTRSSITAMSMLPAYQSIIGMGQDAIPLIIAQLKSEGDDPDQWFWALQSITQANPSKPEDQGDFSKMAQSWIRWVDEEYDG